MNNQPLASNFLDFTDNNVKNEFATNPLMSLKCQCDKNNFSFNLGVENQYSNIKGLRLTGFNSNSWPCRGQQTCKYFDNNPLINNTWKRIDLLSLPPN